MLQANVVAQTDLLTKNYLKWFHQHGGFIDGIQISQENGIRGLYVTKPLDADKAVIAVPNKIVISTKLASKSDLKQIYKAYPDQYDKEYNSEADYNKLALFVFYEKLKGEKSFYFPLFAVTKNCSTILEWSENDLEQLKDPYMKQNGLQFQQLMLEHWHEIKSILKKYPKLFVPQKEDQKDLYYWSYQYVMTRIFQWGQPCPVLLPLAEFQNHQSSLTSSTEHFCFNRNFEEAPAMTNNKPYLQKHQNIDVTLIKSFGQQTHCSKKFEDVREAYIQDNLQFIEDYGANDSASFKINAINWKKTKESEQDHIFNQTYFSTSNDEDNDTEQDYEYEEEEQPTKIDAQNPLKHRETDFSWYKHDDNETFFLVVTKRPYQVGEQLCCSYGRRTSRYLLKWYGFCELYSKNDSLQFQLWINQRKLNNELDASNSVFREMVQNQVVPDKMLSEPYKLKSNMLNEDLLIYLRNIVSEQMNLKLSLLALPTVIDVEIQVDSSYLLKVFDKLALILGVFKDDVIYNEQELLTGLNNLDTRQQSITIYRLNRSLILNNQINMVTLIGAILQKLKDGVEFRNAYMETLSSKDLSKCQLQSSQIRDYLRQLWVGIYSRK